MPTTLYWHDYETTSADPSRCRPLQFAGVRTDEQLNVTGEPLMLYCKPSRDLLPSPMACLVTGITPQQARRGRSARAGNLLLVYTVNWRSPAAVGWAITVSVSTMR